MAINTSLYFQCHCRWFKQLYVSCSHWHGKFDTRPSWSNGQYWCCSWLRSRWNVQFRYFRFVFFSFWLKKMNTFQPSDEKVHRWHCAPAQLINKQFKCVHHRLNYSFMGGEIIWYKRNDFIRSILFSLKWALKIGGSIQRWNALKWFQWRFLSYKITLTHSIQINALSFKTFQQKCKQFRSVFFFNNIFGTLNDKQFKCSQKMRQTKSWLVENFQLKRKCHQHDLEHGTLDFKRQITSKF